LTLAGGKETIWLAAPLGDDMNATQETAKQGIREISEHARTALSDPQVMPYYAFAAGAIATSMGLYFAGKKHESLFFALWPPTIIAMAILSRMSRR
jgi:hypothetical protein